jgi:hypothetical protein
VIVSESAQWTTAVDPKDKEGARWCCGPKNPIRVVSIPLPPFCAPFNSSSSNNQQKIIIKANLLAGNNNNNNNLLARLFSLSRIARRSHYLLSTTQPTTRKHLFDL